MQSSIHNHDQQAYREAAAALGSAARQIFKNIHLDDAQRAGIQNIVESELDHAAFRCRLIKNPATYAAGREAL